MNDKDRENLEQLYEELSKEQRLEMIKKFAFRPKDVPPPPEEPDTGFLAPLPSKRKITVDPSTYKAGANAMMKMSNSEKVIRKYLMDKGFEGEVLERKIGEKMKDMIRNRKRKLKE